MEADEEGCGSTFRVCNNVLKSAILIYIEAYRWFILNIAVKLKLQNQSCTSRTMCTTIRPKTNLRIYLAAEVRAGIKSTILQTASDDICNDHANKPQEDGEDNRNNQIEPFDQGIILTPLPSLLSGDEDFSIQVSLHLTKRFGKYFEGVLSEPGFKPCYTRF